MFEHNAARVGVPVAMRAIATVLKGDGSSENYGMFQCPCCAKWYWDHFDLKGGRQHGDTPEFAFTDAESATLDCCRVLLEMSKNPDFLIEMQEPRRIRG